MRRILGGLMLAALVAGCDNPSNEAAFRKVVTAVCSRMQGCAPDDFAKRYGSLDACVASFVAAVPASKLDGPSACSDAEVQACVNDVNAYACAAFAGGAFPSSCDKCRL